MKKIKLSDQTPIYCIKSAEAIVLDDHVQGYFNHGIKLKDGDVVVDVGANIGVFGLRASQMYKNITIHSFEPVPTIFEVLKKNSNLSNNKLFYTYQMGLGSKEETLAFTYFPNSPALSTSNPEMWDSNPNAFKDAVKGSIKNSPDSFWWSKLIPNFTIPLIAWYLRKGKKTVHCRVATLSSMIESNNIKEITLLKMDCEGQEWDVLMGIDDSHWDMIRSIVMEVHDVNGRADMVIKLLKDKGFIKITGEKEKSLENTNLINLYAVR